MMAGNQREPLAIVGMACRFPGGVDAPEALWNLLLEGRDAIGDIPASRWNHRAYYDPRPGQAGKTVQAQAGCLADIESFDAGFFGISPREAHTIDPQQRMMLELAWEALEDAGLPQESVSGSPTAVFVGCMHQEYLHLQDWHSLTTHSMTGGANCMLSNRISYHLNLLGPSMTVDTACASGLTSLHLACQSLWHGESSLALAGAVNLFIDPRTFVAISQLSMLSEDSRCRPFDASGQGYARSEGAAMLVVKPLRLAVQDGDRIQALILATAVNHNGRGSGPSVPRQEAQVALLGQVYADAQVSPWDLNYLEAHGTGTPVGDPVEAAAIGQALSSRRPPGRELPIGSVKGNLGHSEGTSGLAGVIKAVLVARNRSLPPTLHFDAPNPHIPFGDLRLRVPVRLESLPAEPARLLLGVTSMGFGGSNGHVVLASAPSPAPVPAPARVAGPWLLPLSARSSEALKSLAAGYIELVKEGSPNLADLCTMAARRRTHHPHRAALVAADRQELLQQLAQVGTGTGRGVARVGFVFCGQGSQWAGMGRLLWEREPVFREVIVECDRWIREFGEWSLQEELMAVGEASRMHCTAIAQPAIFAVQAGLTALWRSWGIEPEAVVGHSVGEVAAAWAAGALSLEQAVRVIFERGRTMERASSQGQMLAVALSEKAVQAYLDEFPEVCLGAVNSPLSVTLSGAAEALEGLAARLQADQVWFRLLDVEYAFHSSQMDPVEPILLESLADVRPTPLSLPMISTVTGRAALGQQLDAHYWWQNVRQPVRFAEAIEQLVRDGITLFLEVGPHAALAKPLDECLADVGSGLGRLASMRRFEDQPRTLWDSLGALYQLNQKIRWKAVYCDPGRWLDLPRYPWQRQRYWCEEELLPVRFVTSPHAGLGYRLPLAVPTWHNRLTAHDIPWLDDYRVHGELIVATGTYLAMALAAARALAPVGTESVTLEKVTVSPGTAELLQTSLCQSELLLHARRDTSESWRELARAQLVAGPVGVPSGLDVAGLGPGLPAVAMYQRWKRLGYDCGPAFSCLRRLGGQLATQWGHVALPEGIDEEAASYAVHPGLLEGCLQLLRVEHPELELLSIRRLTLWQEAGREVYVRVRPSGHEFDLHIYRPDGRPVLHLWGCLQRKPQAPVAESVQALFYQSHWLPRPLGDQPEAAVGRWLLLADEGGVALGLERQLQGRGHTVQRLRFEERQRLGDVLRQGGPLVGIVHMWSLDEVEPKEQAVDLRRGCSALLEVVQLLDRLPQQRPGLWVVTSGAALLEECRPALGQSAVWGLTRVIASECPQLSPRLVDIDASQASLVALARELTTSVSEPEVALRHQQRYLHRYRRARLEELARRRPLRAAEGFLLSGGVWRGLTPRSPLSHEVLVEVAACCVPGVQGAFGEFAGTILEVGSEVIGLTPGQRVMGVAEGNLASHLTTAANLVVQVPAGLSSEAAAATPLAFLIAHYALGGMQPGQRVLVNSEVCGLAAAAMVVGKGLGCQVFSHPDQVPEGEEVDVILGEAGGAVRLADFGRRVLIGQGRPASAQLLRNQTVQAIDLDHLLRQSPQAVQRLLLEAAEHGQAIPFTCQPLGESTRAGDGHKVVLTRPGAPPSVVSGSQDRLPIQAQASYWISGGLGGLGLVLAGWLVERGARHLVLLGRQDPSSAALARLNRWREGGVDVRSARLDVADYASLEGLLGTGLPPLRGVFHLANQMDPGALLQLDDRRLERVCRPKMEGAWNLHRLTKGRNLDFFVLFSSVASLLGSPGQGNYCAANAFLDGLAHYRRALGLPALTINWGAWQEAGYLERHAHVLEQIATDGVLGMSLEEGLQALEALLVAQPVQAGVLKLDWDVYAGAGGIFQELSGAAPAPARGNLRTVVGGASGRLRLSLLTAALQSESARILRSPQAPAIERPLLDLGFDSLMNQQLRNWVQAELGIALPANFLSDCPCLADLAERLASQLDAAEPAQQRLDDLSDAEVELRLRELFPDGVLG